EKRGLRERIAKTRDAPAKPFAIGEFELVLEAVPGRTTDVTAPAEAPSPVGHGSLVQLRARRDEGAGDREGRSPPRLDLCRACNRYVYPHEVTCPHCGTDIARAAADHAETVQRRRALVERLERALAAAQSSTT